MTGILLGLLAAALIVVLLLSLELKSLRDQMAYINREDKTNKRLSLGFHGFFLDSLVMEINKYIDQGKIKEEDLSYEKEKIKNQITSISHDLRTPLTSIVGYLDLLEKTKDPEEYQAYMTTLKKKTQSLQKLVVDFYDISLLEDKKYQIDLEDLAPSMVLEDKIMEYYKDLEDRGIKLEIDIENSDLISSNSQGLSRVYSNLLSNIKNHGCDFAKIVHKKQGDQVFTTFSNKISAKEDLDVNKIFEKFYTGQKSRNKGSSGIGMYASKVILEKMGHDISADLDGDLLTITIKY